MIKNQQEHTQQDIKNTILIHFLLHLTSYNSIMRLLKHKKLLNTLFL